LQAFIVQYWYELFVITRNTTRETASNVLSLRTNVTEPHNHNNELFL